MANSYGKRSKKLSIAKELPPLFHKKNNENFDIKKIICYNEYKQEILHKIKKGTFSFPMLNVYPLIV